MREALGKSPDGGCQERNLRQDRLGIASTIFLGMVADVGRWTESGYDTTGGIEDRDSSSRSGLRDGGHIAAEGLLPFARREARE